jgi:hypothetical protein
MSGEGCPTFRPTLEEFRDFATYIKSIEPHCAHLGCAKIIPPHHEGWWKAPDQARRFAAEQDIIIDTPGIQMVSGSRGVFSIDILEGKTMGLAEFQKIADRRDPRFNRSSGGRRVSGGSSEADGAGLTPAEVERLFWKTVGLPKVEPVMYGADSVGTLVSFRELRSSWLLCPSSNSSNRIFLCR